MLEEEFPLVVMAYVTSTCQHRCAHCFLVQTGDLNHFVIPTNHFAKFAELASHRKACMIGIAGGDPFLHPDIDTILTTAVRCNLQPLLACNPSIELSDKLPLLQGLGINTVQFSLDSDKPAEHDAIRGNGAFRQLEWMCDRLTKFNLRANLSICLTTNNAGNIPEMIAVARRLGIFKIKFSCWMDVTSCDEPLLSRPEFVRNAVNMIRNATRGERDWVRFAGYDLSTGLRVKRRLPEVVLMHNGQITDGDYGSEISHILHAQVGEDYDRYIEKRRSQLLDNLISGAITSVSERIKLYENDAMLEAGSVCKLRDTYLITINNKLPPMLKKIVILHELGHLFTNSITQRDELLATSRYSKFESLANGWVMNNLKPYLSRRAQALDHIPLDNPDFCRHLADLVKRHICAF